MNAKQTPRNQDGQSPTREPEKTAQRLEQNADEQDGEADRARTEEKSREARDGSRREVRFGG